MLDTQVLCSAVAVRMVCLPSECTEALSSGSDSFDVEKAIAALLADPDQDTLELPCSLSAEQRKQAKKTIEQHHDLKCESFGLGADRRMHIFKCKAGEMKASYSERASAECSPSSVSVKNTFIDDWTTDAPSADQRIVQSMPHNMFGKCLTSELAAAAAAAAAVSSIAESIDSTSPPAKVGVEPVIEENSFSVGAEVVIEGLVKAPAFNGAIGTVHSWDVETMRYNVFLAFETPTGQRWAKVKGENLNLVSPGPPEGESDDYLRH